MWAFDIIELNGDDLRCEPLKWRKATLGKLLARAGYGVQLNEHLEAEGPVVFDHACRMGLEGIVSKRKSLAAARAPRAATRPHCRRA
jgi:bifunctional non-homologous end joining protein LigD